MIQITKGHTFTRKARESMSIAGMIGIALMATAATHASSTPKPISDEEARGYVEEALAIEKTRDIARMARQENPESLLVGVGCGPNGDQIILANEEDEFPFTCQAIEAHYLPGRG